MVFYELHGYFAYFLNVNLSDACISISNYLANEAEYKYELGRAVYLDFLSFMNTTFGVGIVKSLRNGPDRYLCEYRWVYESSVGFKARDLCFYWRLYALHDKRIKPNMTIGVRYTAIRVAPSLEFMHLYDIESFDKGKVNLFSFRINLVNQLIRGGLSPIEVEASYSNCLWDKAFDWRRVFSYELGYDGALNFAGRANLLRSGKFVSYVGSGYRLFAGYRLEFGIELGSELPFFGFLDYRSWGRPCYLAGIGVRSASPYRRLLL